MGTQLVNVRRAVASDVPVLVRMCRDFITMSQTGISFDADYLAASLRASMVAGDRAVFVTGVSPTGLLWAGVCRSPVAPINTASEIAFWVDPAHRGRGALPLIRAYIDWSKSMGCDRVSMSCLASNRIDALYRREGLDLSELTFSRLI